MVEETDLTEGDDAKLTFVRESRITGTERREVDAEVLDVSGEIVTLANPFGYDDPVLVVDPDGDVWARDEGADDYYGRNAMVEPVN